MPNNQEQDPYELAAQSIVAEKQAQGAQALRASLYTAVQQDPDAAAKDQDVAKTFGVSPELAKDNPELHQAAKLNQINPEQMLKDTPKTALMMADPAFAATAHDDVPNLSATEKMGQHYNFLQKASAAIGKGEAEIGQTPGRLTAMTAEGANMLANKLGVPETIDPFGKDIPARFDPAAFLFTPGKHQEEAADEILEGADRKKTVEALALQTISMIPMIIMTAGSGSLASTGAKLAGGAGAFGAQATGEQYESLKNQGVEGSRAIPSALVHGATAAAAAEVGAFLPVQRLFGKWAGELGEAGARAIAKEVGLTIGQSAVLGGAGSAGATFANAFADAALGDKDATKNLMSKVGQSALVGSVQAMALAGSHVALSTPHYIAALGELAKNSKAAERSPEQYEKFMQAQTEGVKQFIDKDALDAVMEKHGIDPEEFAKQVKAEKSYSDAKVSGAQVELNPAALIARFHDQDVFDDILKETRPSPDAPNANEAMELQRQLQDAIAEQKDAHEESMNRVFEARKAAINENSPDTLEAQAEAEAKLYASLTGRAAQWMRSIPGHENIMPEDIHNMMPLLEESEADYNQRMGPKDEKEARAMEKTNLDSAIAAASETGGLMPVHDAIRKAGGLDKESLKDVGLADMGRYKIFGGSKTADQMAEALRENGFSYIETASDLETELQAERLAMENFKTKYGASALRRVQSARFKQEAAPIAEGEAVDSALNQVYPNGVKASIDVENNAPLQLKALMRRFQGADPTSGIHELGHYALELMRNISQIEGSDPQLKADLALLEKRHGVKDGAWTKNNHEAFASDMEKYIYEGKAPSVELRPTFEKMRQLMMGVYKLIRDISGKALNPDTRHVFDRMFASERQLDLARASTGDDDFMGLKNERIAKAREQARLDAESDMAYSANKDMRKRQELAWHKSYKEGREQVSPMIQDEPRYKAEMKLRGTDFDGKPILAKDADGEVVLDEKGNPIAVPPVRIDKAMFVKEHGREAAKNLPSGTLITEGGMEPDQAAAICGYESSAAMMKDMAEKRPFKQEIDFRSRNYADMMNPMDDNASLAEKAMQAVHNDSNAKRLELEQKYLIDNNPGVFKTLIKKMAKLAPSTEVLRAQAKDMVNGMRVSDVSTSKFAVAEARARREAADLFTKGNLEGCNDAKTRERLNHELYREAAAAKEFTQDALDYNRLLDKASYRDKIEVGTRDLIDSIRDSIDFRKTGVKRDARKIMDAVEGEDGYAANGYEPSISESVFDAPVSYKIMSNKVFQEMVQSMRSLDAVGRDQLKAIKADQKAALESIVGEIASAQEGLKQRGPGTNRGLNRFEEQVSTLGHQARSFEASLLKMRAFITEWIDNGDTFGPATQSILRPLQEKIDMKDGLEKEIFQKLHSPSKAVGDTQTNEGLLGKIHTIEGCRDSKTGKDQEITTKEKWMIMLNMGNESNLSKMLKGEGVKVKNAEGKEVPEGWDREKLKKFMDENTTPQEWDMVQHIWGSLESLHPLKLAMNRRLGNSDPERIDPQEVVMPFGKYKGGYFPMVYDPARNDAVNARSQKNDAALFENSYTKIDTDTGSMNTRNKGYAAPVRLDFDLVPKIIANEIHDICMREAVINANKIISHPDFRSAVVSAHGQELYNQLRPWLKSVANDGKNDMKAEQGWMNMLSSAVARTTAVNIGYRVSTMAKHGVGALTSGPAELGPTWYAKGLKTALDIPHLKDNVKFIMDSSPEMERRFKGAGMDSSIDDTFDKLNRVLLDPASSSVDKARALLESKAYAGIIASTSLTEVPLWHGAYIKAMTPVAEGGLGKGHEDAAYYATRTVVKVHGSGELIDKSAVQRSDWMKPFTMFYSFWSNNLALQAKGIHRASDIENWKGKDTPETMQKAATLALQLLSCTYLANMAHHLFSREDKDKKGWLQRTAQEGVEIATSGIPIARDIIPASMKVLGSKGNWSDKFKQDYSASPVLNALATIAGTAGDIWHINQGKKASKQWVHHATDSAGLVANVPGADEAGMIFQYLYDMKKGKAENSVANWWNAVTGQETSK